jgi:hypothetical protein
MSTKPTNKIRAIALTIALTIPIYAIAIVRGFAWSNIYDAVMP